MKEFINNIEKKGFRILNCDDIKIISDLELEGRKNG